jgi:hypothetical protein
LFSVKEKPATKGACGHKQGSVSNDNGEDHEVTRKGPMTRVIQGEELAVGNVVKRAGPEQGHEMNQQEPTQHNRVMDCKRNKEMNAKGGWRKEITEYRVAVTP